jgi:hypothetical protein
MILVRRTPVPADDRLEVMRTPAEKGIGIFGPDRVARAKEFMNI